MVRLRNGDVQCLNRCFCMEPKVREVHTDRSSKICTSEQSNEVNIPVGTMNGLCGGTQRRKKANASEIIMAEIPLGVNGRGSSQEALSGSSETVSNGRIATVETGRNGGAMEAPCVTHSRAGVLENIKKNSEQRVTGLFQRKHCKVCVGTPGSQGMSC